MDFRLAAAIRLVIFSTQGFSAHSDRRYIVRSLAYVAYE